MIGIFGGSFDPVHNGHIHIATQTLIRLQLDQVQFIPSAVPVHRAPPQATPAQRSDMLQLVLAEHPEFSLNTLELERQGPSYTIDSLREIRARSNASLCLLLGADAFNGFANWKDPDEILRLAHIVVCLRPGIEVSKKLFLKHWVASPTQLQEQIAGAILMLAVDAPQCSSSTVRATLAANQSPARLLHPGVAQYIKKHRLYRRQSD